MRVARREPGERARDVSVQSRAMSRRFLLVLGLAACVMTGSCGILSPGCGPRQRDTIAWGEIGPSTGTGEPTLRAGVTTVELEEGGGVREVVTWYIIGSTIKPHVTKAELRDAADGTLLFVFPVDPSTPGPEMRSMTPGPPRLVSLSHLRGRLREGQAVVEVSTSLPDQPLLRVRLTTVRAGDFKHGDCL
jgi:hypothetical protein